MSNEAKGQLNWWLNTGFTVLTPILIGVIGLWLRAEISNIKQDMQINASATYVSKDWFQKTTDSLSDRMTKMEPTINQMASDLAVVKQQVSDIKQQTK